MVQKRTREKRAASSKVLQVINNPHLTTMKSGGTKFHNEVMMDINLVPQSPHRVEKLFLK
jgi:hypothetical protein